MRKSRPLVLGSVVLAFGVVIACAGEEAPGEVADERDAQSAIVDAAILDGSPPVTTEDAARDTGGPVTRSLGGVVKNLRGTGLTLKNGSETLAVPLLQSDAGVDAGPSDAGVADVPFTFATKLAPGAAFDVSVASQPTGLAQTCTVAGGAGAMGSSDMSSVSVSCATETFAVGGTVSGLPPATTVELELNGTSTVSLTTASAGFPAFTFPMEVEDGQPYEVKLKTQPANRRCSVTNGTGTIAGAAVKNVTVTCACSVLVLGAAKEASTTAFTTALQAAGLATSTVPSWVDYAGAPAASEFNAVVITVGDLYQLDMPAAGQTSIIDAFNAGTTGVVTSEWGGAYIPSQNRWQTLKAASLFTRSSGHVPAALTLTVAPGQEAHPIWAGLPASFTTVNTHGGNVGNTLVNGGTLLATCPECGNIAVAFKDGAQRAVQHGIAMDYTAENSTSVNAFTNDPNVTKLFVNSAKWAARCQ